MTGKPKIEVVRDVTKFDTILIRISEVGLERMFPSAIADEMGEAIKRFIATDAECQILINQMVRDAFKQVNLLELVTEAVAKKIGENHDNQTNEQRNR